jgi:hypothetical protein
VTVKPGTRLVLYTDGLIERRAEPIDAGFGRLARAAGQNSTWTSPRDARARCSP